MMEGPFEALSARAPMGKGLGWVRSLQFGGQLL